MSEFRFFHRGQLPPEPQPDDCVILTVGAKKFVAVIGWGPDWAAYVGPRQWPDEQVARRGDKIMPDKAMQLFPECARTGRYYRL